MTDANEARVETNVAVVVRPRKMALWVKVCLVVFVCCAVAFGVILRGSSGNTAVLKGVEERGGGFDRRMLLNRSVMKQYFGISDEKKERGYIREAVIPRPTREELLALHGSYLLTALYLADGRVDESLFNLLGDLYSLTRLHLIDYDLTDQDLRRVMESLRSPSQLGFLELRKTSLTDEGLVAIGVKTPLIVLLIDGSKIEGSGLKQLNLSGLYRLSLQHSLLSDSGLSEIARQKPPKLLQLKVDHSQITDEGLKSLSGLTSLHFLGVGGTEVTPGGLAELLKKLPITGLGLNELSWTMEDLKRLSFDATKLSELELAGWNIGDEELKSLPNMPNLTSLDLSRTRVTDEGLKELARFSKLNSIQLDETQITIQGLKSLQKSFSLGQVSISKTGLTLEDLMSLPSVPIKQTFFLDGMNLTMDQLRKLGLRLPNASFHSDNRIVFPQNR